MIPDIKDTKKDRVARPSPCHSSTGSCGVLTMSIQCCSCGPLAYMKGPNTSTPSRAGGSGTAIKTDPSQGRIVFHCPCLENKAVAELGVGPRAPGLGLAGPPVVREQPELHQHDVAMKTGREVAKAEQGDHELLAAVSVLHREAETGGHAGRRCHHLVQRRNRVETGHHRPHWEQS
ncbi:hypothetical protein FQN60_002944 [Etheostoma spectabile]|uniref:Uncharacterized protein n=1 Tax=Etheostoma spectabile TaxID=54343 RepID=A0A5J5CKX1_9PERO|nr:hypothetical protein FQN60_002944 [Etheostoma spectabile]